MAKIKTNEELSQTLKEAVYIFYSGYRTGCGFTLEDWFKAQDKVHRNLGSVRRLYWREEGKNA